jgi:hypothetical protein
MCILMPCTK